MAPNSVAKQNHLKRLSSNSSSAVGSGAKRMRLFPDTPESTPEREDTVCGGNRRKSITRTPSSVGAKKRLNFSGASSAEEDSSGPSPEVHANCSRLSSSEDQANLLEGGEQLERLHSAAVRGLNRRISLYGCDIVSHGSYAPAYAKVKEDEANADSLEYYFRSGLKAFVQTAWAAENDDPLLVKAEERKRRTKTCWLLAADFLAASMTSEFRPPPAMLSLILKKGLLQQRDADVRQRIHEVLYVAVTRLWPPVGRHDSILWLRSWSRADQKRVSAFRHVLSGIENLLSPCCRNPSLIPTSRQSSSFT